MGERCVLGVDGGNTKTVAVAACLDGTVVGVGQSGCSDIYGARSVDEALEEVEVATAAALAGMTTRATTLRACTFSLAGADWPEDIAFLRTALLARGYGGRIEVINDAMGALRTGSAEGTGVAVVCGTGAAIGARAANGRQWHTSWWQEPQGSRQLAEKTLRAVYRTELGIDPPTTLTARVLRIFAEPTVEHVLHRITARETRSAVDHAALTSALLEEATTGDRTATHIVRDHGHALGDYAVAAAAQVGMQDADFVLVLTGGVFRNPGSLLTDSIIARVRATHPRVRPVTARFEPVVGAVLLALEATGVCPDGAVISRLTATLPPGLLI